jgi:hypothetical protein
MVLDPEIGETLSQVYELLRAEGDRINAQTVKRALDGPTEGLAAFLVSNELWGGSGSIGDYSILNSPRRREFDQLLIKLGRLQLAIGHTNVRTEMWVQAFEHWRALGIR